MPYLELSFTLPGLDPDEAESACFATGALSVTLSDEHDDAIYEPGVGELRLWPHTRLKALFPEAQAGPTLLVRLAHRLGVDPLQLQVRAIADRHWEREWLQDFHAMQFGHRLWICPQHESVKQADAVVVQLDPGLAFGTGTHPSTALCLEWLDGSALSGARIIDYGCGSGVLAIAALKLGARRAFAIDIDPQALQATQQNAERNGVAGRIELCAQDSQLPQHCELVVANILSDVLLSLAQPLQARVAPGGVALLSGILTSQEAEVAACYSTWFDMKRYGERDGWVALQGQRGL